MTANSNRPTIPSSLTDTKPAVEVQPAPGNGQIISATRVETLTYGHQPQQQQPTSAGGFPILPLVGLAALVIGAIAAPGIINAWQGSQLAEERARTAILERRLERAESDQQQLTQLKENLCYGQP